MSRFSRILSKKYVSDKNIIEEQDYDNNPINFIEETIDGIEQSLNDWTIPKMNINSIYKIGTFDYFQSYSIKMTEQTLSIGQNQQNLNLLSLKSILEHRQKYKFLHIGLVQIAIKPLFRIGIDAPVLLILRDKRHKDFQNSILAMAETNIANGPIYFNCYPNFSVGLFDKNILDTLVLTVETKNLEFKDNTRPLAIIYRVCYKTMTTTLEPRTRISSPRNETIIFEANTNHTKVHMPKRLKWSEITQSCNWNLQNVIEPKALDSSKQISNIIEHNDGSVDVNFSSINFLSSRFSTSSIPETGTSKPSFSKSRSLKLKTVDYTNSIPKPLYQEDQNSENSLPSPTKSDFIDEFQKFKQQTI